MAEKSFMLNLNCAAKIIHILNIRRFDNFFNKTIKDITKPLTNDMVDIM